MIPGFKASANATAPMAVRYKSASSRNTAKIISTNNDLPATMNYPLMGANEVEYVEITKTDFLNAFDVAEERMKASGKMSKSENFWKRFRTDPAYKEEIVNKLMKQYKVELDNHKALDAKLNH